MLLVEIEDLSIILDIRVAALYAVLKGVVAHKR